MVQPPGNNLAKNFKVLKELKIELLGSDAFLHAEKRKKKSFPRKLEGFPGGAVVKNLPANAGDTGSSPGLGRSHMPRSN